MAGEFIFFTFANVIRIYRINADIYNAGDC